MVSPDEFNVLLMCVEWFLYGIYSGIFAIYLHYALTRRKESRTTTVVFYALCLLYFLFTATVVSDLLVYIVEMRIGTLPVQLQDNSQSTLIRVSFVEIAVNGCSDFIAQCTLIYRCWIVWGKNTRVVIIPSFLAITYIVTWIASEGAETFVDGEPITALWGVTLVLTGLATSMVVNALVTGLIAFKILKVFLEVKATSVERTLGSLSSTAGGPKLRHIIFIVIESGMALFAIQLVRVVISIIILLQVQGEQNQQTSLTLPITLDFVIAIHEMLNGIAPTIILVRVSMRLSIDDEESFKEALGSLNFNNLPSDPDSLQGVGSSSSSMPFQEDNYFDNPPSDPNTILEVRRVPVGSSGSTGSYAVPGEE